MSPGKSDERAVKVTVAGESLRLLEALQYLEGEDAANLLGPAVVNFLEAHRDDPGMAEALKAKQIAIDAKEEP